MAETPSTMLELGTSAPDFSLPDARGNFQLVSRADYAGKPMMVIFSCNHCPYVIHIIESFTDFANQITDEGFGVVMISANDVSRYTADSPDQMTEFSNRYGFKFAYLYDEAQQVALAYKAACTPDIFLFDSHHKLVYRGQYDDSRPGNGKAVTGADLKSAVDALQNQQPVNPVQIPSVGCGIKWKPGNEPSY